MRGSRHADHARAFDIDQRHPIDAGDALHRQRRHRFRTDQGAGFFRRKGVADPDRDIAADRRGHGLRMDDLGAEVSQLHRLVIRE